MKNVKKGKSRNSNKKLQRSSVIYMYTKVSISTWRFFVVVVAAATGDDDHDNHDLRRATKDVQKA